MRKEYDLSKLKKRKTTKVDSKTIKVSKTVRLDPDILLWLQEEAEKEGIGYQTFLNWTLRRSMNFKKSELDNILKRLENLEKKVG
jgi:uncharacterized protein (DUF4415 family)